VRHNGPMSSRITDVPPIRSDDPDSFPRKVLDKRHPALIDQVLAAYPYPPRILRALTRLRADIAGTIEPLPEGAHDGADWDRWGTDIVGRRWIDVPFLWAESYFYRLLLEAVEYFRPGPWRGIDPFAPQKSAELADPALAAELTALDGVAAPAPRERTSALVRAALWGNRADLGFRLSDPEAAARRDRAGLIVDDTDALVDCLDDDTGTVCLVADNSGRELIPDLVLIDHLLTTGAGSRGVDLHLKPSPYFVSDATTADLLAALGRMRAASGGAEATAARLSAALRDGGLHVTTHEFYCAPLSFHDMPEDLAAVFAAARLTVVKGDLNYRRLVGDRRWQAATPFDALTAYFPGPVAALRTLKSDVAVGIDDAETLDRDAPGWRTSGTHAVIQMRP